MTVKKIRRHRRTEISLADKGSYDISEFCGRNSISRSFFYKMKKNGKGPKLKHIDGKTLITHQAEREWQEA